MISRKVLCVFLEVPAALIVIHTIVRIVRHFRKFPIPRSNSKYGDMIYCGGREMMH